MLLVSARSMAFPVHGLIRGRLHSVEVVGLRHGVSRAT
jgi:hypothetical protein